MNAPEAMTNVRNWYASAGAGLQMLSRAIQDHKVGECSIPTRDAADKILDAAKHFRLMGGQLEHAVEEWIDAQEPPLRPPSELPFDKNAT